MRMASAGGFAVTPELVGHLVEEAEFLLSHAPGQTALQELEDAMNGRGREALMVAEAAGLGKKASDAWKMKLSKLKIKPLLTGTEVQELLDLDGPSPEVGEALRSLRRAQLEGKVRTSKDARAYVRHPLRRNRHQRR